MNGDPKEPQEGENVDTGVVHTPAGVEGQETATTPDRETATEVEELRAIAEVTGEISPAVQRAANIEKEGEKIPELDPKKLTRSLIFFINRLKSALPNSKIEAVTAQETFLRQVMVEICLVAQELKRVMTSPSGAGTPEARAAVKVNIDPEIREEAQSLWREQLSLLADILNGLAQEGPVWIATLDDMDRFTVSRSSLKKISALHEAMLNAYRASFRWKDMAAADPDLELKKKREVISSIAKEQKFLGLNNEDLADGQIDEAMYRQLEGMLNEQHDPSEIARWFLYGVKINFQHLGNSLAAQKEFAVQEHLNDIENGADKNPRYYTPNDEASLFESEAFALALYLCVIDRNAKAILASQKLASLIRDDE